LAWSSPDSGSAEVGLGGRTADVSTVMRRTRPVAVLFMVLLTVYGVPHFAGLPTWPNASLPFTPLPRVVDDQTFWSGFRPFRTYVADRLRQGEFPTWLPTQALGVPLVEQYEFQVFNPLEWINWVGQDDWWTVVLCAELALGGIGVFLFGRRILCASEPAALAGALVYTLVGVASYFYMTAFLTELVPLPYVMLFAWSIVRDGGSLRRCAGLTTAVALILLGGQPQIMFCDALALTILVILELICLKAPWSEVAMRSGALVTACVSGALVAAPQIVPFIQDQLLGASYSLHRIEDSQNYWRTPPINLLNPVSPFLQGSITPWANSSSLGLGRLDDFGLTLGAFGSFFVLIAACAAYAPRQQYGRSWSPGAQGVARRLVFVFGAGLLVVVVSSLSMLPVWPFAFVNVNRYGSVPLTAIGALLVAIGVDRFDTLPRLVDRTCIVLVALVPVTGAMYLARNISAGEVSDLALLAEASIVTVAPLAALGAAALTIWRKPSPAGAGHWTAAVLILAECTFLIRYGLRPEQDVFRLVPFVLLVLGAFWLHLGRTRSFAGFALIALGAFAVGWLPLAAPFRVAASPAEQPASVAFLQERTGAPSYDGRILTTGGLLFPNTNMVFGIPSFASRNPVQSLSLTGYFYEFLRATVLEQRRRSISTIMFQGMDSSPVNTQADLGREPGDYFTWGEYFRARPYFNLLGITYLVDTTEGPLQSVIQLMSIPESDVVPVFREACLSSNCPAVWRDSRALPRAYFSKSYVIVPWTRDAWAARVWLKDQGGNATSAFDTPVVEIPDQALDHFDGIVIAPKAPSPSPAISAESVTSVTANEVEVITHNSLPGLLVLNDAFHPNWRVYVNGKPGHVLRVNSVVRGVFVDGPAAVRFVFDEDLPHNALLAAIPFVGFVVLSSRRLFRRSAPANRPVPGAH
jgi:hypothetical protein